MVGDMKGLSPRRLATCLYMNQAWLGRLRTTNLLHSTPLIFSR